MWWVVANFRYLLAAAANTNVNGSLESINSGAPKHFKYDSVTQATPSSLSRTKTMAILTGTMRKLFQGFHVSDVCDFNHPFKSFETAKKRKCDMHFKIIWSRHKVFAWSLISAFMISNRFFSHNLCLSPHCVLNRVSSPLKRCKVLSSVLCAYLIC